MPPKVNLNRHCLVSWCPNDSTSTSNKVFIRVPQDKYRRERWLKVLKRQDLSLSTTFAFVCEDHFELEKDMSNFTKWKLSKGECRILMNKSAVPHKCLSISKPRRTESQPLPEKSADAGEGQSRHDQVNREPQVGAHPEPIPTEEDKFEQELDVNVVTRDVGINTKPPCRSVSTQTSWIHMVFNKCSPIKPSTSTIATSPLKPRRFTGRLWELWCD